MIGDPVVDYFERVINDAESRGCTMMEIPTQDLRLIINKIKSKMHECKTLSGLLMIERVAREEHPVIRSIPETLGKAKGHECS